MANIGNVQLNKSINLDSSKIKTNHVVNTEKVVTLSSDNLQTKKEIKTGLIPAVKGAGAGLAGVAAGAGLGALIAGGGKYLSDVSSLAGSAALAPSLVSGIVVSQTTDKAGLGALIGSGTGALTGAISGLIISRKPEAALTMGAIGAISGAISGLAASFVTQKK